MKRPFTCAAIPSLSGADNALRQDKKDALPTSLLDVFEISAASTRALLEIAIHATAQRSLYFFRSIPSLVISGISNTYDL